LLFDATVVDGFLPIDGYTSLKMDIYEVCDGGPSYATAVINLTKGEIVWFMTNGQA
jgi:hypothetical protein